MDLHIVNTEQDAVADDNEHGKAQIIEQLRDYYRELEAEKLSQLEHIYAEDIDFSDPIHHVKGLEHLHLYFKDMLNNVSFCRFEFHDQVLQGEQVHLTWRMDFAHPKLAKGKSIAVEGISVLKLALQGSEWRVSYHRDYYDVSEMLHDHVPLLGGCSKFLKRRLAK